MRVEARGFSMWRRAGERVLQPHRPSERVQVVAGAAGRGARSAYPTDITAFFMQAAAWCGRCFAIEAERGRLALWLPVAMLCGVLVFYAAPHDPSLPAAALAFGCAATLAVLLRRRALGFAAALAVAAFLAGFLSAAWQVHTSSAPILPHPMRAEAVGTVESVEARPRGSRVVLRLESLGKLTAGELPERARVTVPAGDTPLRAGMRIAVPALWLPPPGPARPGGYDFARVAFLSGIGAVGSRAQAARVLDPPAPRPLAALSQGIDRLRNTIAGRIRASVAGDPGAIAAALVAGERGTISRAANDAMRNAGLSHVLSISGMHMALFAGSLFAVLRFLLITIPGFAARFPAKKIAALAALLGAAGYLALSGSDVAAERSFFMIALLFIAILADRLALSVRNLGVAAVVVLILAPGSALGPSFQMSFAAVLALVSWYETRHDAPRGPPGRLSGGGVPSIVLRYLAGIAITTLLASAATAPYAAYHFQRLTVHALAANLLALPIAGALIMPWALIGLVLMPFGFDAFAWQAMGYGIEAMLMVARTVSSWPGAVALIPAPGALVALLLSLGLLWLAIWTTRLRWLGLLPAGLAVALALHAPHPDIFVGPGGRAVAVRAPDGRLRIIGARFEPFAAHSWLAADGDERDLKDPSVSDLVDCDSFGCTTLLPGGRVLALDWSYAALKEDCSRAALVVTSLVAPPACRAKADVIDAADLGQGGAISLRQTTDGSFVRENARTGDRIWYGQRTPPDGPDFPVKKPKAETETELSTTAGDGFSPDDPDSAEEPAAGDDGQL